MPAFGDMGGNEVAEGIGGIITAEPLLIGVGFEGIGGEAGVVLEEGEGVEQELAALVDEQGGLEAGVGIAEAALDFGPAPDAVGVGGMEFKAVAAEFGCEEDVGNDKGLKPRC